MIMYSFTFKNCNFSEQFVTVAGLAAGIDNYICVHYAILSGCS